MSLIAYVFPKLGTAKDVIRQMSETLCCKATFESQPRKESERLQHFYLIFPSL